MKRAQRDIDNDNVLVDHSAISNKRLKPGVDCVDTSDSLFDRLPDELILHILALANGASALAAWSLTSRHHHALASDQSLWRQLCIEHYGQPLHRPPWPEGVDWRWIYRAQSHPARSEGVDIGAVRIKHDKRIYWGHVVDGKPHGFGIAIDADSAHCCGIVRARVDPPRAPTAPAASGRLRQGHWIDGKIHGDVIKMYPNGTTLNVQWVDGQRPPVAVLRFPDGGHYQGECKGGKPHGRGAYTRASGRVREGRWYHGSVYSEVVDTWPDGDIFVGDLIKGGTYIWTSGQRYDGQFNSKFQIHGRGTMVYPDGRRYEGDWVRGQRDGHGTMAYPDGARYEGQWQGGLCHGRGTMVDAQGHRYEGQWHCDIRHGYGVYSWPSGSEYRGTYEEGIRRGRGTMTFRDGSRLSGVWEDVQCGESVIEAHRLVPLCSSARPCLACKHPRAPSSV